MKRVHFGALTACSTVALVSIVGLSACAEDAAAPPNKARQSTDDTTATDSSQTDGGDAKNDGTGARADPALYAKAVCESDQKCSPAYFRSAFSSLDDCIAKLLPRTTASLTAPGNTVTPAQLAACTSKLGATCDDTLFTIPQCEFRGAHPDGAPCAFNGQCSGSLCLGQSPGTCGTCASTVAAGLECTDNANCAAGFACVDGACRVLGGEGSSCTSIYGCKPSLMCVGGKCQRRLGLGAPCTTELDCDITQGLTCIMSSPSASQGTCAPQPFAKPGEPCGVDPSTGAFTMCEASRCSSMSGAGTCVAYGASGAPCSSASECESGLDCILDKCASPDAAACK